MHPHFDVNFLSVILATVVQFFIGFVWFTLLFGRLWASEMKFDMGEKPDRSIMIRGMVLNLVGNFLTSYILFHTVNVWRASLWGMGADSPAYLYGFFGALFTWIGFYLPMNLNGVAWQKKSWIVFAIDSSHQFVSLLSASMVVAYWR